MFCTLKKEKEQVRKGECKGVRRGGGEGKVKGGREKRAERKQIAVQSPVRASVSLLLPLTPALIKNSISALVPN